MNLGLLTSYVISGILLMSIIALNMSVSSSSTEITLTQMTREKAAGVQQMLTHDIQKIGYNRAGKTDPMLTMADSHRVAFRTNIDNSYDGSVELVTWELTTNGISSTDNPNDVVLLRTVEDVDTGSLIDQTAIRLGVTNFNVKYLDEFGEPLSEHLSPPLSSGQRETIRQLYVELELQSGAKLKKGPNDPGRYVRTIWEKRFSPRNLESN